MGLRVNAGLPRLCLSVCFAVFLSAGTVAAPQNARLETPETLAYAALSEEISRAPEVVDLADAVQRAAQLDQAARFAIISLLPHRSSAEGAARFEMMRQELLELDRANTELVRGTVEDASWLDQRRYDSQFRADVWLIVQHSSDAALMELLLAQIEPLVLAGEFDGQEYGMMYDRVAINQGRHQRYGSQVECSNGQYVPLPMEDPAHVDQRREEIGFPVVRLRDYLQSLNRSACE